MTFAGYDPSAHVLDDFFANRLAFTVLLNFPLTTLEQRLKDGPKWSRRQWAEVRLAQGFSKRVPAQVNLAIMGLRLRRRGYIDEYNIWMHHLVDDGGQRLFPPRMRLLSHWNLRDEIKSGLHRHAKRAGQAAHNSAGDGAGCHADDSRSSRGQSGRGLESSDQ
jgi:hypothetical protein